MEKILSFSDSEMNKLLHVCHQAFLRAYESCTCSGDEPYWGFVQQQAGVMQNIHDLAVKIAAAILDSPYINRKSIDHLVSMNGRWEMMIEEVRTKAGRSSQLRP